MTKKEIMNVVKNIRNYLMSGNPIWDTDTVNEAMSTAIEALKERPEGEWLCSDDSYENAVCSNCGFDSGESYVVVKYEQRWKACPMCEAMMRGEDNEND